MSRNKGQWRKGVWDASCTPGMGRMLVKHVRDTSSFFKVLCVYEIKTYDINISCLSSHRAFYPLMWFHYPKCRPESRNIDKSQPRSHDSPSQSTYSRLLQNKRYFVPDFKFPGAFSGTENTSDSTLRGRTSVGRWDIFVIRHCY